MTGTESINREVGRRIKLCRRSKGVTLAELGAAVGLRKPGTAIRGREDWQRGH